ncbi:MAG: hypothetical protein PHP01_08610 [Phycisphaerae bacterium]|nr:hypothetical protein [Phycisphaerae bacterium]
MSFRFYSNSFSQISRGFAKGLFVIGLLLIGFGTLVWVLKEIFAFIAAAIFIAVGIGCCANAARVYFASGKTDAFDDDPADRSDNVRIRIEQDTDL